MNIKEFLLVFVRTLPKERLQGFFKSLYLFSLHGRGYLEADMENNGEELVLQNIGNVNNEKIIIFDVGANIGDYSLKCLNYIKNSEVHAFEPSKKTFEILQRNLSGKKILLHNVGFGNKKEKKTLYSNKDGSGIASVYKRDLDYLGIKMNKKEEINLETLDNFCKKAKIDSIDFLKLDVEGHEVKVLEGAGEMLKNRMIKKIQFEFGGCNIDSRTFFKDFWNILNENYNFYRITNTGLIPIKKYSEDLEIFAYSNYLLKLKK